MLTKLNGKKFGLKTAILLLLVCSLFLLACSKSGETIRVSGAWALYPMMVVWGTEYSKTHNINIEVSGGGAGKGMSDVLNGQVDIGMVSRPITNEELEQGAFYLAVTKDAVVATINKDNPILDDLFQQGLSREQLRQIFMKELTHWGEIVDKELTGDEILVYGRSDASGAAKIWASFLGGVTQADCQARANANFNGDQPLARAVGDDKNALGFNNLNYAYNIETGTFAKDIRPLPLDLNSNGTLDEDEAFYSTRDGLVKNISEGKYPSPPARLEYIVSKGPFTGKVKNFVAWILTEGQEYVESNGYVRLTDDALNREQACLAAGKRDLSE